MILFFIMPETRERKFEDVHADTRYPMHAWVVAVSNMKMPCESLLDIVLFLPNYISNKLVFMVEVVVL